LGAQIARAKVRGFQGASLADAGAIAAVAKHYCAYGPVTAGREYASVDISERSLHEVHLPPFEAAVRADVAAIMPAFTDLNGVPMTAHRPLLQGWLRQKLGFDGVLISDYNAIAELLRHGVAADLADAAALALQAGVDIDMMANAYRLGLPVALERGQVSVADIDAAVRRVLRLKERLGLFEDPYRRGARPEGAPTLARRRRLARSVAARSIVLLQNRGDLLPLSAAMQRICVIGPLADAPAEMRGPWGAAGATAKHVSVVAGFCAMFPDADVVHESGVEISGDDVGGIGAAVTLCDGADAIVLCLGEAADMSGEAASRAHLDLPGQQRTLAEAVFKHAKAIGKRVVVVLFSGRPLVAPWLFEAADAVLCAYFLGVEAGNAIAEVITGKVSPSGRTAMSWPRAVGQIPVFFGERPGGRPENPQDHFTSKYMDVPNSPQFPFGFGLSYGRFTYSNLRLSRTTARPGETIDVSVDVTNVGRHAAEETVFLFTRDPVASVTRPLLELKGFEKITLQPGGSGMVTMAVAAHDLRFLGIELQPVFEPGDIEILVGPRADRAVLLQNRVRLLA
jgi:beta-glucosidase